jgi:hypothetical protein
VRRGEHYPATNGDRFAAQGGIERLLDRCVEGIQVRMEDGGRWVHSDRPWRSLVLINCDRCNPLPWLADLNRSQGKILAL